MKNSTVIEYIDVYGNDKKMVIFTPFLSFLLTKEFPWDYLPFCSAPEKCAILDKVEEIFKHQNKC